MSRSGVHDDFYSILETHERASARTIERCYKRLAMRHHPDLGGDVEFMKLLNEAYRVLGDDVRRSEYDLQRAKPFGSSGSASAPPFSSASAQAAGISGQLAASSLCVTIGLTLLFLVRFQWIWFLWPMAILALFVIALGIIMAHSAMLSIRLSFHRAHPARRYTGLQEAVFWSTVFGGGYGIYLVLSAI